MDWFTGQLVGNICAEPAFRLNTEPPWPNGQGAPLLRVRLWVRVPLGVIVRPFFATIEPTAKKNTPCGTQTHNLQIRSLTRYSVAPTGRYTYGPRFDAGPFDVQNFGEAQNTKTKMLQEGLEPPTLGLLDPCSTKLSYQSECACPRSGSNQGPSDLQSDALPTELHGRT